MELSLRRRRKGFDFKPPRDNRFVLHLMYCLLPIASRVVLDIVEIKVDSDSLDRLRRLKTSRAALLPNHPTDKDSVIMFHLAKLLGERFTFLAARELFDLAPVSWLLQRCGVYSVMRGMNDRKSFKTTVALLAEGKRKLVIFPEGLTCWQNDTVMPFQEGVPLFGFWALENLKERTTLEPLYLVPVAIKYAYVRDMRRVIDRSLGRLERKLGLKPTGRTLYVRLREIGEAVVTSAEKEYGVRGSPSRDLDLRIQGMKDLLVTRIATTLGVTFKTEQNLPARIRTLVNSLNEIMHQDAQGSEYLLELHRKRRAEVEHFFDDLSRVLHFVGTYDGYVKETMTAERFLDVIGQLEMEVFNKRTHHGPVRVHVSVGEPMDLTQRFGEYQKDKRGVLSSVTSALEESVKHMLADLGRFATPL